MKRLLAFAVGMCLALQAVGQQADSGRPTSARVRFEALDVYIDAGKTPLAAYQFELVTESGDVKIVGVEGGEHVAFKSAPYYDPAALSMDKVVIAAFNTGKDLPAGNNRVARLHIRVAGETAPKYSVALHVAASAQGEKVMATVSIGQREKQ